MAKRALAPRTGREDRGKRATVHAGMRSPAADEFDSIALLDALPILVWRSGRDGRCDYFNKAWLEFTGRRLEDELGNGWLAGVHPADRRLCLQLYRRSFRLRKPFVLEYRLRRRDGQYRWIRDAGRPLFDGRDRFCGYIGGCLDDTLPREILAALRQSNANFSSFANHLPGALFMKDARGVYVYANPVCEQGQRVSPGGWKGKTDHDLFSAETARRIRINDRTVWNSGKALETIETVVINDSVSHWLVSKFLIPGSSSSSSLLGGAALNITELKQTQDALQKALEGRERLGRDLHDNIIQSIYAAGMELEQIIEIPRRTNDENRGQIRHVIDRLNSVIRDVRRYITGTDDKTRVGGIAFTEELHKLLGSATGILRFRAEIDPVAVNRLSQRQRKQLLPIIREGISNALRHSRGKWGLFAVRCFRNGVRVAITDDGVGFVTGKASLKRGAGLRNMAARCREMGATLDILSSPGHGSRIGIMLSSSKPKK